MKGSFVEGVAAPNLNLPLAGRARTPQFIFSVTRKKTFLRATNTSPPLYSRKTRPLIITNRETKDKTHYITKGPAGLVNQFSIIFLVNFFMSLHTKTTAA
jgi:hypothetical protein